VTLFWHFSSPPTSDIYLNKCFWTVKCIKKKVSFKAQYFSFEWFFFVTESIKIKVKKQKKFIWHIDLPPFPRAVFFNLWRFGGTPTWQKIIILGTFSNKHWQKTEKTIFGSTPTLSHGTLLCRGTPLEITALVCHVSRIGTSATLRMFAINAVFWYS